MAKKQAAEETAIVKEEPKALATVDYSQYEGAGFENHTAEDYAPPFIKCLQPGSPIITQSLVEGAKPGMFYNTSTGQLWTKDDPLILVPVYTKHEYLQWKPEAHGGGFVGRFEIDDPVVAKSKAASDKFGKYFVDAEDGRTGKDGDELQQTYTVFVMTCGLDPESDVGFAIMPFKSTGIKCYKGWMNQARAYQVMVEGKRQSPPLWVHMSQFTSEMNTKGKNTWFTPKYVPAVNKKVNESALTETDPRFLAAFGFYQLAKSGVAKVDYTKDKNDSASTGGHGEADGVPLGPDGKPLF